MESRSRPKHRPTRARRKARRAPRAQVVRTQGFLSSLYSRLVAVVGGAADVHARRVGTAPRLPKRARAMTTEARSKARAAAPGHRLKGDIQATSITGDTMSGFGTWFRGRWGARSSFTPWQLMPPWRRMTCHVMPVVVCGFIGIGLVQLIGDRFHPRIILDTRVVPSVVKPGQSVEVIYTAQDKRRCHGTVHRWIVDKDNRLYALPDVAVFYNYEGLPPKFEFVRDITVPPSIPDGPAVYHDETDRWCNFLQQTFWSLYTIQTMLHSPSHARRRSP